MTFDILLAGLIGLPAVAALIYVLTRGASRQRGRADATPARSSGKP